MIEWHIHFTLQRSSQNGDATHSVFYPGLLSPAPLLRLHCTVLYFPYILFLIDECYFIHDFKTWTYMLYYEAGIWNRGPHIWAS